MKPTAFVPSAVQEERFPDEGVPRTGVTSDGLVARTTEPVPVEVVTPVPPLVTGSVPATAAVEARLIEPKPRAVPDLRRTWWSLAAAISAGSPTLFAERPITERAAESRSKAFVMPFVATESVPEDVIGPPVKPVPEATDVTAVETNVAVRSVTAAPAPPPSAKTMALLPFAMVTLLPEPCDSTTL